MQERPLSIVCSGLPRRQQGVKRLAVPTTVARQLGMPLGGRATKSYRVYEQRGKRIRRRSYRTLQGRSATSCLRVLQKASTTKLMMKKHTAGVRSDLPTDGR